MLSEKSLDLVGLDTIFNKSLCQHSEVIDSYLYMVEGMHEQFKENEIVKVSFESRPTISDVSFKDYTTLKDSKMLS